MRAFQADAAVEQVVEVPTRVAIVDNRVTNSTVDHCYLSSPADYSSPRVMMVGDSDHWGQVTSQLTKKVLHQPGTRKSRVYKSFCPEGFCLDLLQSEVNSMVTRETDLELADAVYDRELQ